MSAAQPSSNLLQLVGNILEGSNKGKSTHKEGVKDHTGALDLALHYLKDSYSDEVKKQVSAIGHRVVHGKFFETAKLVTPEIERAIEDAAALAPLHNPPNLQGITAANRIFPGQPQVRYMLCTLHNGLVFLLEACLLHAGIKNLCV